MKALFLSSFFLATLSCGPDTERPEIITKLRTLGIQSKPLVAKPSTASKPQILTLTVFAALPLGEKVTVSKFKDEASPHSILLDESQYEILSGTETYTPYNSFQLMSFQASVKVPDASILAAHGGKGFIRYGFLLQGSRNTEKVIGTTLIAPASAPEFQWTDPLMVLLSPTDKASIPSHSEIEISLDLKNPNGEDLKLGHFVSGGQIANRRSNQPVWDTPDPGTHTLIATVRGRKSHGFAIRVINVTTN